jgi:hypothetical protein
MSADGKSAPVYIQLVGRGMQRTSCIPALPGLEIAGRGTWPGMPGLRLEDNARCSLIDYPDHLKQGGGGAGFVYTHHLKLHDFTLDGNSARQDTTMPLIDLYNGGFQNRLYNMSIRNVKGPAIRLERTALNLNIDHVDFSNCEGALDFHASSFTVGLLTFEYAQIDECGTPITIQYEREGGLQANLDEIIIRNIKIEWHRDQRPEAFIRFNTTSASHRPTIYVSDIVANPWYADSRSFPMKGFIWETGAGQGALWELERIKSRRGQTPYMYRSDISGTKMIGTKNNLFGRDTNGISKQTFGY